MLRSFFLYFLVFTVSLAGLSVLLPASDAKAASIYDNVLNPVDELVIQGGAAHENCFVDMTVNWANPITLESSWQYTEQYQLDNLTNLKASFLNAINSPTGKWGVSKAQTADYWGEYYSVWWTTGTPSFGWFDLTGTGVYGLEVYDVSSVRIDVIGNDNGTCIMKVLNNEWLNGNGGAVIGRMPYYNSSVRPFFANAELPYPPEYEGEPVSGGVQQGTVYTPQIDYIVNDDNSLQAFSFAEEGYCIPTSLDGCIVPKLRWVITGSDGEVVNKVQTEFDLFKYQLEFMEDYTLTVSYVHSGPPAAPFAEDVILGTVSFAIKANGIFTHGSSSLNDCDVTGASTTCAVANQLKDCTTYGTDVGGYFQCVITNFGIWLKSTLVNLFIPSTSSLGRRFDDFGASVQVKLGFLYTSFEMILQWLNSLLVVEPDCTVDLGSFEFFGSPIAFNFCAMEQTVPTIYNPLMILGRSIIAAMFVFIGVRRLMEIVRELGR